MRITNVISGLSGGGAERACINLANAWAARGRAVTLLTISQISRPPAYTIDPGVERCDVGWPREAHSDELDYPAITAVLRGLRQAGCPELIEEITYLAMLRYAILATKPDVVISYIDKTNVCVLAAMNESGAPVIACEQTDTSRISLGPWQNAREALYRRAPAVVAPDPVIADWLAGRGAVAWAIHNPLFAPPRRCLKLAGSPEGRHRLVTLARLSPEKRHEFLIRSFASIAGEYPEWDLEIYGEGPPRNFLEHLAEELAPSGQIQFRGFTNDPYGVLRGADLFVSASWVEGFGNAIWEALACGVPVVAMDAGSSVRSLVRDGIDGLIVEENTMAALASALASLMGNDRVRQAHADRAPEVLERFSIESALLKWDALLKDVTSRKQRYE